MQQDVTHKIDQFFSGYPTRTCAKGQILIFANEEPKHIFYIKRGRIRQYDVSYKGDEVIVNIFKPPAFFPMSWAINGTPNKYFFEADTGAELHVVPAEAAVSFIQSNPDVLYDLLGRVYRGTDGLLGRIVHLMSGSAKSRVVYELIIESERFGKQRADGNYELSVTESDLGARAGLSRETVSRELQKLKDQHIVELQHQTIVVRDIAMLKHWQDD